MSYMKYRLSSCVQKKKGSTVYQSKYFEESFIVESLSIKLFINIAYVVDTMCDN